MKNKFDFDTITSITMLLQIVLSIYVVTFGVAGLYVSELFKICQILIGGLMFAIAYNNHRVYKRKYMTAIYLGLGLVIIVAVLFS